MSILSPYVSMHHVHAGYPQRPEESVRSSGTGNKETYEHAYRKHKNTGFLEAKCSKPLKHLSSLIPLKQKTSYYKCEWGSLCKGCKCQQMPKSQKLWVSSNWGCELPDVVPRVQIQVLVKGKQCILSAAEPSSQPLCFFFHGRIHL